MITSYRIKRLQQYWLAEYDRLTENIKRDGHIAGATDNGHLENDYNEQLLSLKRNLLESIDEILSKAKTLMVSLKRASNQTISGVHFRSYSGRSSLVMLSEC